MLKHLKRVDANFCFEIEDKRLYVTEVSHGVAPSGTVIDNLIRESYHLHFVFDGTALFDNQKVEKGSVFLMDPLMPHSIKVTSNEPFEQYWLQFSGSEADRLLKRVGFGSGSRIIRFDGIGSLRQMLNDAVYGSDDGAATGTLPQLLSLKLTGLLVWLLGVVAPEPEASGSTLPLSSRYVRSAMEFLRSRCSEGATVAEAAEYVGLTEKYLCKLFKSEIGVSPRDYLRRYRLDRAAILLTTTVLSVTEISAAVGFSNQTYFSRFFRQNFGRSPSEYRDKYKNNADSLQKAADITVNTDNN